MYQNKEIVQTILITLLAIIAGCIGVYSMPIIAILYPILLTLIGIKNGIKYNIISIIISSVFIGLVSGFYSGIFMFLDYGILSMCTTYMINKKYRPSAIILGSILIALSMDILHIGLERYVTGINFITELNNLLAQATKDQLEVLKDSNLSQYEISTMTNVLDSMINYLIALIPTTLIISSTFIAYINYLLPTKILKKSSKEDIYVPYFSKMILPLNSVLGAFSIFTLTYLLKYFANINYEQMMLNVVALIFCIFYLEGLSLVVFLINRTNVGKIMKPVLVVLIILSGFLNLILFFIGILDVFMDFRRLREVKNP